MRRVGMPRERMISWGLAPPPGRNDQIAQIIGGNMLSPASEKPRDAAAADRLLLAHEVEPAQHPVLGDLTLVHTEEPVDPEPGALEHL